jgi:hypothetical protein
MRHRMGPGSTAASGRFATCLRRCVRRPTGGLCRCVWKRRKPLFPPVDPASGLRLLSKGTESRSTLTVNGRIELARTRWFKPGEGSRTPADQLVDRTEATISLGVRELCCQLNGDAKSFERAAENLGAAAQVQLSGETLRNLVESEGQRVQEVIAAGQLLPGWTPADCVAATVEGQPVTRVYLGSDAFTMPTVTQAEKDLRRGKIRARRQRRGKKARPLPPVKKGTDQRWKEAKVVTFYDQTMAHRLVSVTQGNAEAAGRLMRRDAEYLDFHRAQERVGNIDGGPWIIRQIQQRLDMTATGLDFYHLGENVHKSRRIVFGEENAQGRQWADQMLHTVKHEGYEPLWNALLEWRKTTRGVKRQEADRLIHYVCDRRDMIRYPQFLQRGWQIGSGPTESQCRLIPERVKGVGMRWDPGHAQAVMSLEALHQSRQWSDYWKLAHKNLN